MSYCFGPVRSRRLGLSLGVDVLPRKTCNLNCIYCELGPTLKYTTEILEYIPIENIWNELKATLTSSKKIFDYLTFTASGEPTLYSKLGELIIKAKEISPKPITVLTNATTVMIPEVRKALCEANILLPSLDAATQSTFLKINQPAPEIKIKDIIKGLCQLRKEFKGQIWLEVLLVRHINDTDKELLELKKAIEKIEPDKVQLNTVARPPAYDSAKALSQNKLNDIAKFLGPFSEVIVNYSKALKQGSRPLIEAEILEVLKRRPSTVEDLAVCLGIKKELIEKNINRLLEKNIVKYCPHNNIPFLCIK